MRLNAALIFPSSSSEVTGRSALSPCCAMRPAALVSRVTGAVMRRESQAAAASATAATSMPPSAVVVRMRRRSPCDSVSQKRTFHVHVDGTDPAAGFAVGHGDALSPQLRRRSSR